MEIAKQSTILFDDDDANIELALRDGVRAIWINPERSHLLIGDILAMPCTTLMK
jgi:FMN phosphatase YigB (HAD superfamily)